MTMPADPDYPFGGLSVKNPFKVYLNRNKNGRVSNVPAVFALHLVVRYFQKNSCLLFISATILTA